MAGGQHESKTALLNAAASVIRSKGYTATRIEDICEAAELTKGSFFHHFKTKEELAVAAAEHWSLVTGKMFATAAYRRLPDPLDRVLGYIDFRKALIKGDLPELTCLAGTMIQEVYNTHPAIREACERVINEQVVALQFEFDKLLRIYRVNPPISAKNLALYTQAVIQGAFILAKAKQDPTVAIDCIDQLHRYIELLFRIPKKEGPPGLGGRRPPVAKATG
jgi:TetR/AcrR family transcriptional repressor of nem operon